jgi:signal transduction histidine kinase
VSRLRSKLPYVGLAILLGGLFGTAFHLNRRHYRASVEMLHGNLSGRLEQELGRLRMQLADQESTIRARLGTSRILEADLFRVREDGVIPVCADVLHTTLPAAKADDAFQKGLSALPGPGALPFFRQAAQREVKTADDLYRRISACFNLLELEDDPQTICTILTLMEHRGPALTDSQKRFFDTLLTEQAPELEWIRNRCATLWKLAGSIDSTLQRQAGASRLVMDGKVLAVDERGLAVLYETELQATPPHALTDHQPDGIHAEILPGLLWVGIPSAVLEQEKRTIRNQYRTGNGILILMLLPGLILAGGLYASSRRQRELDVLKTRFIATVSHELRTPLSLIRLHAETLRHGRVSKDKIQDYYQTILTESERLTGIVNNVLEFSRIERHHLQLHPEATDLSALCQRIIDSFRDRLRQDGFQCDIEIPPGLMATVDPLAFSQIVFNLLDNAIKYSEGEKFIWIALEQSEGGATLRIADQGLGIPEQMKEKIFDDFVRSDDSRVTARRGSGIGLGVARHLAESMGGTIDLENNKPSGSIFIVRLKDADETPGG